jgi:hypothetical protein
MTAVPQGPAFLRNWATTFLRSKGHRIDTPEISADGMMRTAVNGRMLTNEQIVREANSYSEWNAVRLQFLAYLNSLQHTSRR